MPQLVTEFPKKDITNSSLFGGLLLLLCALTFYYFAVLRIDYQKTALLDLGHIRMHPSIRSGQGLIEGQTAYDTDRIRNATVKVSAGYPALCSMAEGSSSSAFRSGPFRTNQTIGLLLLLAIFAFTSTWRCL